MSMDDMLAARPDYDPAYFLDTIRKIMRCETDAEMGRALGTMPPVISNIRHGRVPVGATLMLRIHEVSGLSLKELKSILGERRGKRRLGQRQAHGGALPSRRRSDFLNVVTKRLP